jgi:trimethyllysine dioxygenase
MADTAYTPKALRPHTDATYSHDAPGLQMLLCLAYDAQGGESLLVDGLRIAETLRAEAPDEFDTLTRIQVPGQYLGDGAHLMARRPAIRLDANGEIAQISFNNYDRAPFRLPDSEMAAFYDAIRAFDRLANDPALQWRHLLAPGELVVFDNWRVLHARLAFSGYRKMTGCYVNREDFESALRVSRN